MFGFCARNTYPRRWRRTPTQKTPLTHFKKQRRRRTQQVRKYIDNCCPTSSKFAFLSDYFSSFLLDRLEHRPRDVQKGPRERLEAAQKRPNSPQELPKGPLDPPAGGPKSLKMQQGDLTSPFWDPRAPQEPPKRPPEAILVSYCPSFSLPFWSAFQPFW